MPAGFYWSANSPFIQSHWVRGRRAPRAPALGNVESGFIDLMVNGRRHRNANPAYMIYEILTNTMWGMGAPASQMDAASFSAAAQLFRNENFGLFMKWTAQDTIENFSQEVQDHVQAAVFLSPVTGKWTIVPYRADYDPATLQRYNQDTAQFSDFGRKLPGEIVNEIVVKWTNPATEKEETVVAQDLASIVSQGGQIVSQDRNYYGVRSGALAARLAARDLRSAVAQLARCTMRATRAAWSATPGQCIIVDIPDEDVVGLIMRVQSVDYGDRTDSYVKVELLEDIFSRDYEALVAPGVSAQPPLGSLPNPPAFVKVFTLPAFIMANSSASFTQQPVDPEVVAGILVGDPNVDWLTSEPYTAVTLANGSVVQQSIGARDRIGVFPLPAGGWSAEAFTTVDGLPGLVGPGPELAGFAFIGAVGEDQCEVALVQAFNPDGTITFARGVLDTVPRAWPAGTPVWLLNGQRFIDPTFRAPGETVSYRPLMRTSIGLLAYGNGVDAPLTLSDRPYLPLRPANVQVNGQGYGTVALAAGPANVSWANRNRLTETGQILGWSAGTVTPEVGQTTIVEVLSGSGTVLKSYPGLTGTSYTVPAADLAGAAAIRVASMRDGDRSLQAFSIGVTP